MTTERYDFKPLSPRDGYRVERVELGELSLSLYLYLVVLDERQPLFKGDTDQSVLLAKWENHTQADRADCARLELLLQSVVRYFNTGGNGNLLGVVLKTLRGLVGDRWFPGWEYFEGVVNDNGDYEHLFVATDQSGDAVLWVEDQFIDAETSLKKIRKQQERHAERVQKGKVRRAEQRAAADGRVYRMELPNPGDYYPPQLPGRSSDARVPGEDPGG